MKSYILALNILKIFSRHMKQEVELSLASSKWMTHVNKATYILFDFSDFYYWCTCMQFQEDICLNESQAAVKMVWFSKKQCFVRLDFTLGWHCGIYQNSHVSAIVMLMLPCIHFSSLSHMMRSVDRSLERNRTGYLFSQPQIIVPNNKGYPCQ